MPEGGRDMLGKRIIASVFAGMILLKLLALLVSPDKWMGLVAAFLEHSTIVMGTYAVLIIIIGYYVLSSIDLIDLAVVMFLTSLLIGISIIPYSGVLLKAREEIIAVGLGKAWYAIVLWGALAGAVLHRVFSPKRG
jgi:hypothetical protein